MMMTLSGRAEFTGVPFCDIKLRGSAFLLTIRPVIVARGPWEVSALLNKETDLKQQMF